MEINDAEFNKLSQYIKANYGIKLGPEKKALVVGRLRNTLLQQNFESFSDYYNYVVADKTGKAQVALVNMITTNHTYFLREADHFNYFRNKVLPFLTASLREKDMRIWSAGCSTGKEPYTLAMIIDEYLGVNKNNWDTKILATDISEKALAVAQAAVYTEEEIATLPKHWKMGYLHKADNDSYSIQERIRHEVIFRKLNLMDESFPFKKKLHVIFCRNVMIYFDAKTRDALVNKFYNLLDEGGFLFIGHSEAINRENSRFKYVMPAIYRKG